MSALWTAANVFFPDLFKQLPHSETGILLLKLPVPLEFKNKLQIFGFHAIVKKAVITDFLETGWKHIRKRLINSSLLRVIVRRGSPGFRDEYFIEGIGSVSFNQMSV